MPDDMIPMVDTCSDHTEHLCMSGGEILHHLPLTAGGETERVVTDLIPVGEFDTGRSFPRARLAADLPVQGEPQRGES